MHLFVDAKERRLEADRPSPALGLLDIGRILRRRPYCYFVPVTVNCADTDGLWANQQFGIYFETDLDRKRE